MDETLNQTRNQYFCSFLAVVGENVNQASFEQSLKFLPRYNDSGRLYENSSVKILIFPPDSNPLHKLYVYCINNNIIFLQGDFYDRVPTESITNLLHSDHIDNSTLTNILNDLNGSFNGFLLNFKDNKCSAFMNHIGFNFLYYCIRDGHIWLSSSIWPLLRLNTKSLNISNESLQDYILFGYPTSNRTILSNVFVVQPGKIAFISDSEISIYEYTPIYNRKDISTTEAIHSFWSACHEHFSFITNYFSRDKFVATLTGGHDTRVVLNAMLKNSIKPACLTGSGWPKTYSTDAKRSKRIAYLTDCKWQLIDYTKQSAQDYADFYWLSEGDNSNTWMGNVGVEANKHGDITYYGFSGDMISGDCGIANIESLLNLDSIVYKTFFSNYEYQTSPESLISTLFRSNFNDILSRYSVTFEAFKELDPYSIYLLQRLNNRNFRRIGCFSNTTRIGSLPVSLFHDARISKVYFKLPMRLIKNQRFHCILASSAKPLLSWIPANSFYIPLWAEHILLPNMRHYGKPAINFARNIKNKYSSRSNKLLHSRLNDTIEASRQSGIFDAEALTSIINTEMSGSILLFINRIKTVLKLIKFAQGQTIEEENNTMLFASDLTRVKRYDFTESS